MKYILILSLALFLSQAASAQSIRSKINKGNEEYDQEKYEEALSAYQDALLDDPMNEAGVFNKGDALYKLKKYDEAVEAYQKILSGKDINLSAQSYYNIGNAQFQQNKLQECINSYIKSLELNPDDFDVKYNLELARAKLKELADKQPQQQQGGKSKPIKPSEFAKKLKKQAEALAAQRKYKQANKLMQDGLKKDKTVAFYERFIQRIQDIVDINS